MRCRQCCAIPLSSARWTTSPTFLTPTSVLIASRCFIPCLPLALLPSIIRIRHRFSRLSPLSTCPTYLNCLFLIYFISLLEVPATSNTAWLVFLAVQGTLIILLINYISVAFSLLHTLISNILPFIGIKTLQSWPQNLTFRPQNNLKSWNNISSCRITKKLQISCKSQAPPHWNADFRCGTANLNSQPPLKDTPRWLEDCTDWRDEETYRKRDRAQTVMVT